MPVIRPFRRGGRYIEDFEEFCTPELYPVFSSLDYVEEASETVDNIKEKGVETFTQNKKNISPFWKKLLSFLPFRIQRK